MRLALSALVAALVAVLLFPASGRAAVPCDGGGYSYAGVIGARATHGVAATITPVALPAVESGHVAAWVGVGGPGAGPGGADEWIQVGVASFAGRTRLYYELTLPRAHPRYVELDPEVTAGETHRVAVAEMRSRRGWWRVWVDRKPVAGPFFLPGSHGAWQPVATAESWDGGWAPCNRFTYRFSRVRTALRAGRAWRSLASSYVLADGGFRVVRLARAAFVASTP